MNSLLYVIAIIITAALIGPTFPWIAGTLIIVLLPVFMFIDWRQERAKLNKKES
jgi:hypothetical protein